MNTHIQVLEETLKKLKLKAQISSYNYEHPFAVFDLSLKEGGKFKQIEKHGTEIALSLRALNEPLIYPVTKEGVIRMELMLGTYEDVDFGEMVNSFEFLNKKRILPIILGRTRDGNSLIVDLAQLPHLLIGGSTGSGKSIMLHSIICSLIKQKNTSLVLIDPKRVEFSYYNKIKNLYAPIARSPEEGLEILEKLVVEMETRFAKLERAECRDITTYKGRMPYIIVVIDELSDIILSAKKSFQELLCRLAQKSRACGIHIIGATQRPSVDIITGSIKANFPARIACKVASHIDSRTIIDRGGAEKLLGKGDAIIESAEHNFKRFKGAFLKEEQIIQVAKENESWWKKLWNG